MTSEPRWSDGLRASVPVVLPTAAVGVTYGLLAAPILGPALAIIASAIVWSGTAQITAVSVLGAGGAPGLAVASGLLANTRFVPMGFAIAPSIVGPAWRRAAIAATLADPSFALAHDRGRFHPRLLVGAFPLQWSAWVGGSALGVAGASLVADADALGLDVLFPVFYLSLLLPEVRGTGRWTAAAAALAAVITIVATPLTPPGVPIVLASAAALIGLLR